MKQPAVILFASLLVFFSCKKTETPPPATAAAANKSAYSVTAVEGFIVKPTTLSENVTAAGSLIPSEETELHPEASGRVVSINLPEGKTVRKGELLLKIFDEDLKTQLLKFQTQLKQAEITEQRLAELLKVKGVSQQEYDLAALQVQNIKSDIDLTKINIAKTELRAPYDGAIGLRSISPGAYVTPATAVATIRAANSLKLDFAVPEKYGVQLRPGQQVRFRVEGNSHDQSATVIATEQSIDATSRNLAVRAQVKSSSGLLPGAFAEVDLSLGKKQQALMVPNQAIIPQARNKQVIVSKNGKAQFVTVKTGVRQANMIEIIDGISAGDTLATTGILFLRPDAPVKFSKVE
jgi:membrane fusion protein, multidrug efflux system